MSSSRYLFSEVKQISINSNIMYSATFVFLETFFKWEGRWVKVKVLRNVRKGEQEYSKGKVGKSTSPKCTPDILFVDAVLLLLNAILKSVYTVLRM